MRELVLRRNLDPSGVVERVILAHPKLSGESLAMNLSKGRQTGLISFKGDRKALDALRAAYIEKPPVFADHLEVVRETKTEILVFVVARCDLHPLDVANCIETHLGPETVVHMRYDAQGVTWRILTASDEKIAPLLEALKDRARAIEARLARGFAPYEVRAIRDGRATTSTPLDPVERRVWETASQMGYFDHPRRCGIADVARRLDMPRSTLHHRLRRVEEKVNREFARFMR